MIQQKDRVEMLAGILQVARVDGILPDEALVLIVKAGLRVARRRRGLKCGFNGCDRECCRARTHSILRSAPPFPVAVKKGNA